MKKQKKAQQKKTKKIQLRSSVRAGGKPDRSTTTYY